MPHGPKHFNDPPLTYTGWQYLILGSPQAATALQLWSPQRGIFNSLDSLATILLTKLDMLLAIFAALCWPTFTLSRILLRGRWGTRYTAAAQIVSQRWCPIGVSLVDLIRVWSAWNIRRGRESWVCLALRWEVKTTSYHLTKGYRETGARFLSEMQSGNTEGDGLT